MTVEELRQLAQWLEDAGIGVFEFEGDEFRLRMTVQPDTAAGPVSLAIDDGEDRDDGVIVAAELPGIFLVKHPHGAAPLTPIGGRVRSGDLVGLIQVGSIYAPVIAGCDGTLAKVRAAPGTLVGFGTPLFEIA